MKLEEISLSIAGKELLHSISVELPPRSITMILGPNGAGKTLLLRCLAGFLKPEQGRILSDDGRDLSALGSDARAELMSWIPLSSALPFAFTVFDLVLMGRYRQHQGYPQQKDRDAARDALGRLQMLAFQDRIYNSLSRGEQTKVDIARAVASETALLVFDEPFANLDIDACLNVARIFRELRAEGRTLILSHHDLYSVLDLATHIAFLKGGSLVAAGPCAELFTVANLRLTYDVEAAILEADGERFIRFRSHE